MKPLSTALLLSLLATLGPLRADFMVKPNDVVGIAGDSITEQHIYSAFMEDYLLMCQPTAGQKIVQWGWSGEQAPAFLARLNSDILPFKPTVVTTCYGMNDGHYGPLTDDTANTYRKAQTDIVEALKKAGVREIVLGSAKCVDSAMYKKGGPDGAAVYNKTLGQLADIDKEIAQKEGVAYADVYGATTDAMQKSKAKLGEDYVFAGNDGVHPGPNGHLVMAYAFLKALGCDGNIGTITVGPGLDKAEATAGHEIVSCQGGTVTVKSTRYPFCFTGELGSKEPGTTAAITEFFPFNEDLNRLMLVVKGLTAAKAKVTWGATTKEYTSAELASGVNLAKDFLQNPFSDQFAKVHAAVLVQESQETFLSKTFMHNLATGKASLAPGNDELWDQLLDSGMKQHDLLYRKASDLVVPVTHTIKIEPEA
jgi:lysophospholipase L1-like esterase